MRRRALPHHDNHPGDSRRWHSHRTLLTQRHHHARTHRALLTQRTHAPKRVPLQALESHSVACPIITRYKRSLCRGSQEIERQRAKGTPQEANEPGGPHCYRSTHGAAKRPPTPLRHRSTRSLNPLADAPPHKASPIFITLHTSHLIRFIRLIRVLIPPPGGGFKFGGEGIICYFCR